ncbi:mitochondrial carrier domain-containing protein [Rhizophagus diaphanus]|nr:mitochondrial carrier domain-containing protein [Rhizophagus diaphanus] [Rhizophagus sp. MUCL 43196]
MSGPKGQKKNIFASTLAGTGAGLVEVSLMQPTDVLKTRYQSIRVASNYNGISILSSFAKIVKQEGFFALYRGTLPVMCIVTPRVSLQYTGLAMFKPIFERMEGKYIPSGSASAFTGARIMQAITLVTPLELIKIRQQTDINRFKYHGMFSTIALIVREEGITALYKGLVPTIFRQSWGLAVKFTGFALFLDLFRIQSNNNLKPHHFVASGFLSNVLVGILNSPPDVVKTRMQDQSASYKNSWDCVKIMMKYEGPLSLFKGSLLRIIRIAPGGGIQFATFEYLYRLLENKV